MNINHEHKNKISKYEFPTHYHLFISSNIPRQKKTFLKNIFNQLWEISQIAISDPPEVEQKIQYWLVTLWMLWMMSMGPRDCHNVSVQPVRALRLRMVTMYRHKARSGHQMCGSTTNQVTQDSRARLVRYLILRTPCEIDLEFQWNS